MRKISLLVGLFLLIFVSGCASGNQDAPGSVVQTYFQAIVAGDAERIASISCADWESTARDEVSSFAGVKARLENVTCTSGAATDDSAVVTCTGAIVATYNNEDQDFPLEERPVRVVRQSGEWLVCGYEE
jgi:hypothetical protein